MNRREDYLLLFVDADRNLCDVMSRYFLEAGYKTVVAHDGMQAQILLNELVPHAVVIDISAPELYAHDILVQAKRKGFTVPVIATGNASSQSAAMPDNSADIFDYLPKPFKLDELHRKISGAIETTKIARENTLLAELVSLHDITNKLTATRDLEQLLDVTFRFCLDVSRAQSGSVQLVNKESGDLVIVRHKGISPGDRHGAPEERTISKWVLAHGRSLLISRGRMIPDIRLALGRDNIGSALSVPLKVSDEVIGIVNCNRSKFVEPFSMLDLNMVDMVAAQASIAINNATLISSVQQKLDDLSLISSYSEQLMRLVDEADVIKCLFSTVQKHFAVDMIGFLIVHKRSHVFLYWSKSQAAETALREVCAEVIDEYNRAATAKVSLKRVTLRQLMPSCETAQTIDAAPPYRHIVAVVGEAFDYGAMYFGACRDGAGFQGRLSLLASLVSQTRIALTNSKLFNDMKENYIRTIKALAIAVDAKDTYTHGHSENVMNIAEELGRELGLEPNRTGSIRDAGLLHDIGKIGIPGYILNKAGTLTCEEFNGIMKTHSALGSNIVKDVPFLQNLYKLILYHHENFDGSGYPEGLKGEAIPIGARIIHVADAFEAMTSNRPYRQSLGKNEAIKRLIEGSGRQFDPAVIDAFMRLARRKGWLSTSE